MILHEKVVVPFIEAICGFNDVLRDESNSAGGKALGLQIIKLK